MSTQNMKLEMNKHLWPSENQMVNKRKTQKQLGNQLASIRSNHGTEFENAKFAEFYNENGIDHKFSAPWTHQQNRVVERKNKTLEDMARTMFLSSKLPHSFWAEAVNTACYIINRYMTRPLVEKTLYELLKGRKPNISHLRAFECKCFAHNNEKDSLSKFDPRSDEGVFLDTDWVNAMQDELNQFKRSQVWHLVPKPKDRTIIGTKWVFKNKLDEDGTVTRNKMDIKSAFLNGYLKEEVPDIVFSVGLCARFQANPKESHMTTVKRILRYLKGTTDLRLWYPKGSNFNLVGYVDADYAGFLVDRKNTLGMDHFLGSCLLVDFGIDVGCIPIFCDNTSAISMIKNHVHHKRTKHINVRHHFLRDNYKKGLIEFCATDKQIADIFTKALSRENFERNRLELGMIKIT
ncbi:uncharacterized protein [Nicotiana sylvestris]|uniref:uncharacterized protein n=1 Tax=Nicotiana sylvestris TaxID=4096 RepID=UPI00388CD1EC